MKEKNMTDIDTKGRPVMPLDIKGLRALCEAATPGPWTVDPLAYRDNGEQAYFPRVRFHLTPDAKWGMGSALINECPGPMEMHNATAAFIAAARTALPEALNEIERLRAQLRDAAGFIHGVSQRPELRRGAIDLRNEAAEIRARLEGK